MRLERVTGKSFRVVCDCCNKTLWSNEGVFADLDGEPFKAYYCESCAMLEAPLKIMKAESEL